MSKVGRLIRLTRELPEFLRSQTTLGEAVPAIRHRLATREQRFLQLARRAIYGHNRSPYLALLRAAGCEFGDLEALVIQKGLEGALSYLRAAGVYFTFDEFKGRREVVRGGVRLRTRESDFDTPAVPGHIEARSGGSRGPRTSVKIGLPFIADLALDTAVAFDAHDLSKSKHIVWIQGGFGALVPILLYARLGQSSAWLHPLKHLPGKARLAARYLSMLGRLCGRPLPAPIFADLEDPDCLLHWLGQRRQTGPICITTYASGAVRIASAARRLGHGLHGVCFITLGEPFTEAKRQIVQASGARALVRYAFTEAGIIGYRCGTPQESDDLHFFSDSYALIQHPRVVIPGGPSVDAFLFTSLLDTAPKILLNVESGDYGMMQPRPCGCGMGAVGLTTHLSRIRSFEKLSSEGMTFVQTDLVRALEEVLPARFGGSATDYQLVEEEGADGILRLFLLVSPRVGPANEADISGLFLDEIARGGGFAPIGVSMWRRAGTVSVLRLAPMLTGAGKILPFHLARNGEVHANGH